MTQGVFVLGRRPKTKKELKEVIRSNPDAVSLEVTSVHGDEYGGRITEMPESETVYIVGPDPYNRVWYATLTRDGNSFKFE